MFPHSPSGANFNSYAHNDSRYQGESRNTYTDPPPRDDSYLSMHRGQDDRRYPNGSRYLNDSRLQGSPRYINETLTYDDRERLRQRTNGKVRSEHSRSFQRKIMDFDQFGEDDVLLSSDEHNQLDKEKNLEGCRKTRLEAERVVFTEDHIRIRAQNLFEEKIAREKQKEVEDREEEQRWSRVDVKYKVALQRALDDQAAAFQTEAEIQKNAASAEIESLRQKEKYDEERFKKAVAAKIAADRKAERERACKIREKLERDKIEDERRKAQAVQDAEELYAARLKQEAEELNAKRKAEEDRATAEDTAKVFELTRLFISLFEAREARRNKIAGKKNRNSVNTDGLDEIPRELLAQVKKVLDGKLEPDLSVKEALVEVVISPKVQANSVKSEEESKSDTNTEAPRVGDKREARVHKDAAKHGNKTSSAKVKEGSRYEKHTGQIRDGKTHVKYKGDQKEERVSRNSRDRARVAMRWFASA